MMWRIVVFCSFALLLRFEFLVGNNDGNAVESDENTDDDWPLFSEDEMLVVDRNGTKALAQGYLQGKIVALYFSSSWCGPCKMLTPRIAALYEFVKRRGDQFEIVFVSLDHDAEKQIEYYKNSMEIAYGEDDECKEDLMSLRTGRPEHLLPLWEKWTREYNNAPVVAANSPIKIEDLTKNVGDE